MADFPGWILTIVNVLLGGMAGFSAYAVARTAAGANRKSAELSHRTEMEKDAYTRARTIDVETINRITAENEELRRDNKTLHEELRKLRDRVAQIERGPGR